MSFSSLFESISEWDGDFVTSWRCAFNNYLLTALELYKTSYFILFYFILFYFILFYFILFIYLLLFFFLFSFFFFLFSFFFFLFSFFFFLLLFSHTFQKKTNRLKLIPNHLLSLLPSPLPPLLLLLLVSLQIMVISPFFLLSFFLYPLRSLLTIPQIDSKWWKKKRSKEEVSDDKEGLYSLPFFFFSLLSYLK